MKPSEYFESRRPFGADSQDLVPVEATARQIEELARTTVDRAYAEWLGAKEWAREAEEAQGRGQDPTNKWTVLAIERGIDAQRHLLKCILAMDEGFRDWDTHTCLKKHMAPRGVIINGHCVFAVPDPDSDPGDGEGETDRMKLVVIPTDSVVEIEPSKSIK